MSVLDDELDIFIAQLIAEGELVESPKPLPTEKEDCQREDCQRIVLQVAFWKAKYIDILIKDYKYCPTEEEECLVRTVLGETSKTN